MDELLECHANAWEQAFSIAETMAGHLAGKLCLTGIERSDLLDRFLDALPDLLARCDDLSDIDAVRAQVWTYLSETSPSGRPGLGRYAWTLLDRRRRRAGTDLTGLPEPRDTFDDAAASEEWNAEELRRLGRMDDRAVIERFARTLAAADRSLLLDRVGGANYEALAGPGDAREATRLRQRFARVRRRAPAHVSRAIDQALRDR